jgi:Fe-S cluster assembly protein SufD
MTLTALPTTREEDWRYADPAELAQLAPADLDVWHQATLAPGETRAKDLILDDAHPGVHRVRLDVGPGARAELFAVLSATAYTRLEVEVTLHQGAHFQFGGVTIGGGEVTREIVTRVTHAEPDATSDQVVRAVHWDTATGNFIGRIAVARDAQKTDAGQSFKGLLLSRGASANTKPELEIFADDVKCAHGAAIGQMDETAAFYMAARGLPPETARKLLVRAFVADALAAHGEPDALLEAALGVLEDAG